MAKAKTDFSDDEQAPAPRNVKVPDADGGMATVQDSIETIRAKRAAERNVRGRSNRPRIITNYLDAERLARLGQLTPTEVVDCEEAGLFSDVATPGRNGVPGQNVRHAKEVFNPDEDLPPGMTADDMPSEAR
jgi:hypothetical protein